ncbi:MAG: gamma-glutamyltransferase [Anaerolineales bacterium]|nr:gamma-glutamyltransferase [Anaerolineales bacterium]
MIRSRMIATQSEVVVEHGLVVAGHNQEAEAGVRIMQAGGNAVDALVAAAFAGFVVEPSNCGVGGYARLSIYWAECDELISIDAYVRAPGRARPDMFEPDYEAPLTYYGYPATRGQKANTGFLACAVPGAVAGLCAAHTLFGALPLAEVLQPAIEIAERGLPVYASLARTIANLYDDIRALPDTAALLLPNGRPARAGDAWTEGDILDFSALAQTLRRIARYGAAGFHTGPVAEAIERYVVGHGGILTAQDLAAFRPRIMREKPAHYRGYDYISCYDQVSYEALNILACFDLRQYGPDSVEFRHLFAEALGRAFVDSMVHYGDPDFTRSPVNGLASRDYAAIRAAEIALDRATPRPIPAGDPWPFENEKDRPERLSPGVTRAELGGTTQMVAADRAGNLAVTCTSLSGAFGSCVYVPEVGVMLNNSMRNFDPRPDHPNCIQPGKMPIFAAPVIAVRREGRPVFAASGSGGYRIETGVLHTLIHTLDFGMEVQPAVDAPRVHCQGEATYVSGLLPEAVKRRLAEMGHDLVEQTDDVNANYYGRVCAIHVDPRTRLLRAGSGPAWQTAAAGF